jgi:PKHD-type hydroxylase
MFLEIHEVLARGELDHIRQLAMSARFVEGRRSSPHSTVKNNQQIDHADPAYAESSRLLAMALQRSEAFRNFAYPKTLAPPMLAKYAPGMNYGIHADAAFMPLAKPLRSDLSCTVFISTPESYGGGELAIHLGVKPVTFKCQAGSAIVYPSNTLHEVRPVTSGERLVGLTFIESLIADTTHRNLMYELDEVAALEGLKMSWDNRTRLQCVRNNLLRMWSTKE